MSVPTAVVITWLGRAPLPSVARTASVRAPGSAGVAASAPEASAVATTAPSTDASTAGVTATLRTTMRPSPGGGVPSTFSKMVSRGVRCGSRWAMADTCWSAPSVTCWLSCGLRGRGRAGGTDVDPVGACRDVEGVGDTLRLEGLEHERTVEVDVGHDALEAVQQHHVRGAGLGAGRPATSEQDRAEDHGVQHHQRARSPCSDHCSAPVARRLPGTWCRTPLS